MPDLRPECSNILLPVAIERGRRVLTYPFFHALYFVTRVGFFVIDILLPRGATAAIGYCLIPVLARRIRDRRFLILMTGPLHDAHLDRVCLRTGRRSWLDVPL